MRVPATIRGEIRHGHPREKYRPHFRRDRIGQGGKVQPSIPNIPHDLLLEPALFLQDLLPLRRFFNTSGLVYKSMGLKDKLPDMTEDQQLRLLSTDGMLVKRPVIIDGDRVWFGFKGNL